MLKVITTTSQPERAQPLLDSLKKFNWNHVMLVVDWRGFGGKLIETYNYLKANPDCDRFIFCDAHDVICLGTPEEFEIKIKQYPWFNITVSAEKGLWPPSLIPFRTLYKPLLSHGFNYPNSGLYYAKSEDFIRLFEKYPPFYEVDDQLWFSLCFQFESLCSGEYDDEGAISIHLDYSQLIFNSHSFIGENEYGYENNRVQINGASPLFVHFNGNTVDPKFNELIKL